MLKQNILNKRYLQKMQHNNDSNDGNGDDDVKKYINSNHTEILEYTCLRQ